MTVVTAPSHAPILSRSRRRIAIWALALMTLGGAAAGTAVAASHNGSSAGKAVPTDSPYSYHFKRGPGPQ